jgi:nucleoside-diphosphate-sugar epimerase
LNIFITGISGYLGGRLAARFAARGHQVSGSARRSMELPHGCKIAVMSLGDPFDEALFEGADVVIHTAHDFSPDATERNVRGTRAWFEAAVRRGVTRQVFLSSHSSRADAPSDYGRIKFSLEQFFLDAGQPVLRPGLVIGNGALFAKQRAALLRTPVMPVIGQGAEPVAVVGIAHFLDAATVILETNRTGVFHLLYDEPPTSREYVRAVKANAGQRILFLPISLKSAVALARIVRALRLPIPVDPDQIQSLSLSRPDAWRSDLPGLLPEKRGEFTLDHALAALKSGL